jgi:3-oxoacid CoA-transferase subunit A
LAQSKVYPDAASALKGLTFDGMTVMSGGFGLSGNPENLITALKEDGTKNITLIANNCGADGLGLWVLLNNGQIKKMISSYVGENKLFEELYLTGKLELELTPQGTLAERIRAGGAGIPAFYTRTGVGTVVAEGKPTEDFDGLTYVRERWLRADVALVKAWKGDTEVNPMMATAGKVTIAEVEELVEPGELDPDKIHTPGIFVQRILQGRDYKKHIERVTTRPRPENA